MNGQDGGVHADDDWKRVYETTISLDDTAAHWCMGGRVENQGDRWDGVKT